MRLVAGLACGLALVLGGCGGGSGGEGSVVRGHPPQSGGSTVAPHDASAGAGSGLVTEIDDLAFSSARDGLLAAGVAASDGQAIGSGLLERTTDGGSAWTAVWRRPETRLTWIGFAGRRSAVAAGVSYPQGADGPSRPILVTGGGGRVGWRTVVPVLPAGVAAAWEALRFDFVDAKVGFATVDPNQSRSMAVPQLLRTVDGGAHWTRLTIPGHVVTAVDFVSPRVGYATASSRGGRCAAELLRTADAGGTWQGLRASCRSAATRYMSVEFVSSSAGFIGGFVAGRDYDGSNPTELSLSSADGGASWHEQTDPSRELSLVGLDLANGADGLAATQNECKLGGNEPCGGDVLSTRNGGDSWGDTGVAAQQLASVGAQRVWVVPPCEAIDAVPCAAVRRTTDGGRIWRTSEVRG